MTLAATKPESVNIVGLLSSCHQTLLKEDKIQKLNYTSYQNVETLNNREEDYKIKYAVPFISAVFHINDDFQLYWDVAFDYYAKSNMSIQERQTADAKLMTIQGCEIGAVEIKPFNTPEADIDLDLIRLGEITKRMLHLRVLRAKSDKEFKTFGILIYGSVVDYYVHEYHPPMPATTATIAQQSLEPHTSAPLTPTYTFTLIHRGTLPTLPSTYTHMMLSLEYLYYFKKLMQDSLAGSDEIDKPYLYNDMADQFTPTVTLLKFE